MLSEPLGEVILDLMVDNRPGVLAQITGLFARIAINVEKVCCVPVGRGDASQVLLHISADSRLPLLIRQLEKIKAVRTVCQRPEDIDFRL